MKRKILTFKSLDPIPKENRVHCHGVFDLLHYGHILHLEEAKALGKTLIVTITADRYVNKGPNHPHFPQEKRAHCLAALQCVDFVIINDAPDAIPAIETLRPAIYVKGEEYRDHAADKTGKIALEAEAVNACGGKIYYTGGEVHSSTHLINQYLVRS